ncbi:MAG TPA: hypothetical protein VFV05_00845 [Methylomirabilota bacterium]|nr:hypothetical protein [Methylomirabilota bacterium]
MLRRALSVAALLVLAGCARATLPYKPESQPEGARVSAAYQVVGDRLGIEIDTDGRPLEQAWIMKPDGAAVAPQAIDAPPVVSGSSSSVGIGIGGGTWGSRGGVGTGVSVGIPVGGGSTRVAGNTLAWFPLGSAGPPPWRLYVKLAGIEPTTFLVGDPPPR